MSVYSVTIKIIETITQKIEAGSAEEAEDTALESLIPGTGDTRVDVVEVQSVQTDSNGQPQNPYSWIDEWAESYAKKNNLTEVQTAQAMAWWKDNDITKLPEPVQKKICAVIEERGRINGVRTFEFIVEHILMGDTSHA